MLPRDAELLAFEAGCEDYCEREVDDLKLQGGRVYLHLGIRRDDSPRGLVVRRVGLCGVLAHVRLVFLPSPVRTASRRDP